MRICSLPFTGFGDTPLHAQIWLPDQPPVMVLQVTHGMTEHIGRYDALAQALTQRGIAVAGFDLRGHGQNPGDARVASLGKDGWSASLEDIHRFHALLVSRFPGATHGMLGFSLGSFLLREYLHLYPSQDIACAAILGTGQQPGAVLAIMRAIVRSQINKAGFDAATPLVRALSFGAYNRQFAPNRTEADWLCADHAKLDAYLADPLCRSDISAGLFDQLLSAMQRTARKDASANWRKDMPVLLLSGQDDPVGGAGKSVQAVEKQMQSAGLTRVQTSLFPGARHDVLHEEACGAAEHARKLLCAWLCENISELKTMNP